MVQRSIDQLALPSSSVSGRRVARLYQHVDDPTWLLSLAEWSSREAFEAYRRSSPMPGTPDQPQRPPSCRTDRRLTLFERVLTPVATVQVAIVDGPAETQAARRDLVLAYHRSDVRGRPEPALLQVDEALDGGPGLLVIAGWAAGGPLPPAGQDLERVLLDRLLASGGTAQRFVGRVLAEASAS